VQSILAALHHKKNTGVGQKIDACLLNSIISFHIQEVTAFLQKGVNPERSQAGIPNPWLGAPYGLYHSQDGYIAIGMNSVQKLAEILGVSKYDEKAYASNNVIEGRDSIWRDFNEVFMTKTTKQWLEILLPEDIWCSEVNSFTEMVRDPQVLHNKMIQEYDHPKVGKISTTGFAVTFSETPQNLYRPAPLLGEHSTEILKELCGYTESEIDEFMQMSPKNMTDGNIH
jgi:crotonobetainyl-CoA:carnitine CoA-transferase CaiB-like acyl-CoA transferase